MKKPLLIGLGFIILLIGIGAFTVLTEPPEKAYGRIQQKIQQNDWENVYVNLSSRTQRELSMALVMAQQHLDVLGVKNSLGTLSDKQAFALAIARSAALRSLLETPSYTLSSVEIEQGVATLAVSVPTDAQARTVKMIRENGTWVLDLDLNAKASGIERPREP